jgi:hypothetical protein
VFKKGGQNLAKGGPYLLGDLDRGSKSTGGLKDRMAFAICSPKHAVNMTFCGPARDTVLTRGAGSNVKRRGQPFQKGTCFSAIIFLSGNIC